MCKPTIRRAERNDRPEWTRMRIALWPNGSEHQHTQEIDRLIEEFPTDSAEPFLAVAAFVAVLPSGSLCGFIEVSLRNYAEDCDTSPVGYIEGSYVDPELRRQGVGQMLAAAAEQWSREHGCSEIASDTAFGNMPSGLSRLSLLAPNGVIGCRRKE